RAWAGSRCWSPRGARRPWPGAAVRWERRRLCSEGPSRCTWASASWSSWAPRSPTSCSRRTARPPGSSSSAPRCASGAAPPPLRPRLDRAVRERERLLALGIDPLLMPSGGKGDADPPAESEAMAAYLIGTAGVPADRVRAETSSRTTEENLVLAHRLLDAAGLQGPY